MEDISVVESLFVVVVAVVMMCVVVVVVVVVVGVVIAVMVFPHTRTCQPLLKWKQKVKELSQSFFRNFSSILFQEELAQVSISYKYHSS